MKQAIKYKIMVDKIQTNDNHYLITHNKFIADLTFNARQLKRDRVEKKLRNSKDNI